MRSNVMVGLLLAVVMGMSGCGGGGSDGGGSTPAQSTPLTPAETAAAKLATLKQVEGNWMFSYTTYQAKNEVLKLSYVIPYSKSILGPQYDYLVSVTSALAGPFIAGFDNSTGMWTIEDQSWYDKIMEVGYTTKYQFKTDGNKILAGACAYIVSAANQGPVGNKGATSACYPLSGVKTP